MVNFRKKYKLNPKIRKARNRRYYLENIKKSVSVKEQKIIDIKIEEETKKQEIKYQEDVNKRIEKERIEQTNEELLFIYGGKVGSCITNPFYNSQKNIKETKEKIINKKIEIVKRFWDSLSPFNRSCQNKYFIYEDISKFEGEYNPDIDDEFWNIENIKI